MISLYFPSVFHKKKNLQLLAFCLIPAFSFAQQKLTEVIGKNYRETLSLPEDAININSGSLRKAGVREVGRVFEREFQKIGFETEWLELPAEVNRAGHFIATRKGPLF